MSQKYQFVRWYRINKSVIELEYLPGNYHLTAIDLDSALKLLDMYEVEYLFGRLGTSDIWLLTLDDTIEYFDRIFKLLTGLDWMGT